MKKRGIKMKKLLSILVISLFSVLLFACNGTEPTPSAPVETTPITGTGQISGANAVTITVGDTFDEMEGVTATDKLGNDITASIVVTGALNLNTVGNYTLTYTATESDGTIITRTRVITVRGLEGCDVHQKLENGVCVDIPPTTIVIMHGAPFEVDPFHQNFTGTEQLIKQQRQREVEALNNVIIEYRMYPSNAPWGPDRVTAIIQSSVSGAHLADVYWTTSDWIQSLANAEAIVPVDQYLETHGANIHPDWLKVGAFKQQIYGFGPGNLTVDSGLYYNANLVASLGVDNPTDLYLSGQWTWSRFETWATQVKTALAAQGDDMYALGGILALYAENMIPLNGGRLINQDTGRVAFAQAPALATYNYLHGLYTKGLFELTPAYDAGSPEWMAGKVAMHPGNLWFVTAPNRWGSIAFELGFVPYPRADDYTGPYVSPVSGVAVYNVASGMTPERQELVFKVWNELQIWKTNEQLKNDFELALLMRFDQEKYVEAYLDIYDKIYLELINALGISPYGANGFRARINAGIREGNARTVVDEIKPIYDAALEDYLS
jgi:fructooligosaccharide transport system substrate-binding protein